MPKSVFQMSFCFNALQVLDLVKQSGDEDGNLHCIQFLELPSRELYPDYFDYIKTPISLNDIETKIKNKVRRLSVLPGRDCNHVCLVATISPVYFGCLRSFLFTTGVHED